MEKLTKEKEVALATKGDVEKHRDALKAELLTVSRELENQLRLAASDEKMVADLNAQVKKLTGALINNKDANMSHSMEVAELNKKIDELDNLIIGHKTEEGRLRKVNYELEKQREKAIVNASSWHHKFQESQETLKIRDLENAELTKKNEEERARLKTQQALYVAHHNVMQFIVLLFILLYFMHAVLSTRFAIFYIVCYILYILSFVYFLLTQVRECAGRTKFVRQATRRVARRNRRDETQAQHHDASNRSNERGDQTKEP